MFDRNAYSQEDLENIAGEIETRVFESIEDHRDLAEGLSRQAMELTDNCKFWDETQRGVKHDDHYQAERVLAGAFQQAAAIHYAAAQRILFAWVLPPIEGEELIYAAARPTPRTTMTREEATRLVAVWLITESLKACDDSGDVMLLQSGHINPNDLFDADPAVQEKLCELLERDLDSWQWEDDSPDAKMLYSVFDAAEALGYQVPFLG